jgi:hypothetical protein
VSYTPFSGEGSAKFIDDADRDHLKDGRVDVECLHACRSGRRSCEDDERLAPNLATGCLARRTEPVAHRRPELHSNCAV